VLENLNARHPASIQPLCFWNYLSWINVSYCGRNYERILNKSGAIFTPLLSSLISWVAMLPFVLFAAPVIHAVSIVLTKDEPTAASIPGGGGSMALHDDFRFTRKADIKADFANVGFVPIADIGAAAKNAAIRSPRRRRRAMSVR